MTTFQPFVDKYGPMVLVLLVLVVADLGAGVAVALKTRKFEWAKLGETYRTTILPNIGGWIVVAFVTESIAYVTTLPAIVDQISLALGTYGFYGVSFMTILASLLTNLNTIAGRTTQVVTPPSGG